MGAQTNRLIETVRLGTHSICFGWEIRKLFFCNALITKGLRKHDSIWDSTLEDQKPLMGTLTNSDDPDEMPHNGAFHQGLHCLLRQNQSSEKEI